MLPGLIAGTPAETKDSFTIGSAPLGSGYWRGPPPELTLARLARRFSSLALPDPGPLPASIPDADPPEGMELIAVPTGLNKRVAAYAYRGGSVFDRRDFYIGAALIKHPQGDLLVDSGFGRDIAWQSATMPRYFRAITGTSCASRPRPPWP
jgi:hypothetical protein